MNAPSIAHARPNTPGIWLKLGLVLPLIAASSLAALFAIVGANATYVAILWGALVAVPATAAGLIAMHWSTYSRTQRGQSIAAAGLGLALTWLALYATFALTLAR